MPYVDPKEVISPKLSVSSLRPICDLGENEFSIALMNWDGEPRMGIRWNGSSATSRLSPGNPQSRGLPTWFVIPEIFVVPVLETLLSLDLVGGGSIDRNEAKQAIHRAIEDRVKAGQRNVTVYNDRALEETVMQILKKLKAAEERPSSAQ